MGISTHILDTAIGRPAAGVPVSLALLTQNQWLVVSEPDQKTDADGRCRQLLPEGAELVPGVYRIRFDTGHYYRAQQLAGLYPWVEITFEILAPGAEDQTPHYHIPLLLTANGYTTYRGS
jgi:5-hydroxyisourate hydrolase